MMAGEPDTRPALKQKDSVCSRDCNAFDRVPTVSGEWVAETQRNQDNGMD